MTAEQIYVDPSALCRLFVKQDGSREMAGWRRRVQGSLPVTHHGRVEIVNCISLALFRGQLSREQAEEAQEWLAADFVRGNLVQVDLLWRSALNQAADLSRAHTPDLGIRSLDVLHVACALELKLRCFLTFDLRQRRLAVRVGLRAVVP